MVEAVGPCPAPPAAFGLGAAGNYTVLGLAGGKLVISEGGTKITGDVGLGSGGTGSLLKATIDGKLYLHDNPPPAANPDIHGDLTTISGGPVTNVISLAGVNLVKGTLTISGSASSLFIFNVTGGFNFSSSKMVLAGGVQANNIIWNFIGPGADIDIFKPGTEASGTFLAPYRNITQDHTTLNGRYIGATGGLTLKMHSAATVTCP